MKSASAVALVALLGALLPGLTIGQEIDPFYARLLDDGVRSSERGDYLRATEELRIAAFGLMEAPPRLARALTHLALAHSQTGKTEELVATLRRLAELETRFGAYSDAELDLSARGALDLAVRNALPDDEGSPLLAPRPEAGVAESPPAAAAPATSPVKRARLCISWTADGDCQQPGTTTAATEPVAGPTATGKPALSTEPQPEELEAFDRLSGLAAGKAGTKKLRNGFDEARALADLHPDWPEAQRLAGLLGARSASYPEAVTYYRRSGELGSDQPVELFYLAVALFEIDELEEAAAALRLALPGLGETPEIRRYVRQILAAETQG